MGLPHVKMAYKEQLMRTRRCVCLKPNTAVLCLPALQVQGAMKSAFTRTGKRDIWGLLDDGAKSLTR